MLLCDFGRRRERHPRGQESVGSESHVQNSDIVQRRLLIFILFDVDHVSQAHLQNAPFEQAASF